MDEAPDARNAICRICFDGGSAEALVTPCSCSGTHAHVHEQCLLRWRRIQMLQGKIAAASRCEVCGQTYAASLALPKKPFMSLVAEFGNVLLETCAGLWLCLCTCPWAFLSPISALLLPGVPGFFFGFRTGLIAAALMLPALTLFLYLNSLQLSAVGSPGKYKLGLTSFGALVDGLRRGVLLVSVGALGPFERTVLYVLEHSDDGTLALILNKPMKRKQPKKGTKADGSLAVSPRMGGPLEHEQFLIHNVPEVAGAERLAAGVFLSRDLATSLKIFRDADRERASVALIHGFSSWGRHQLEGEVRRGCWGWIGAEHIQPKDILEMDHDVLERSWERHVNSPQLQIFEG